MTTAARIGFIGLGNMGLPMAINLARAGHNVAGFDLSATPLQRFADSGGKVAGSVAEAAAGAEFVLTMLPAGRHVRAVMEGADGLLAQVPPGTLLIDSSTIDVATTRDLAQQAQARGLSLLDAPVSGGTSGAAAGTLTFMVGGEADAFARARPILDSMGKTVVHTGPSGAGQAAKVCNNLILGISMIGVAEAFALADRLGLDKQALFDVSSRSSGQCWSLTTYCPVPGPVPASPANSGYKPGFAAALMLKDLRLAQEAALASGASTPLGAEAAQLYALFNGAGHADEDFSGIIDFLRGRAAKA